MFELISQVQTWVVELAGSPWVLVVVLVGTILDGFFPPAPSEGVIISAAALSAAGDGPNIYLLAPLAAIGAFVGDNIAYAIGSKIPLERVPILNSDRGARAVVRARRTLGRRGASLILGARFIPFGRVAVNMTAGAVAYPRARFAILSACAAVVWASYSVGLGISAGAALQDHPLLGVLAGVTGGVLLGFLLERVLGWAQGRFLPDLTVPGPGEGPEQELGELADDSGGDVVADGSPHDVPLGAELSDRDPDDDLTENDDSDDDLFGRAGPSQVA